MIRGGYFIEGSNTTSVYESRDVFGGEEGVYAMMPSDVGVGNFVQSIKLIDDINEFCPL